MHPAHCQLPFPPAHNSMCTCHSLVPARCQLLFPTAHKTMCTCHSLVPAPRPLPFPTAHKSKCTCHSLVPAHCPLLFPTAHNSMCHCHSSRLVPIAITGRHCNWLADLAERSAALCTPHTAWCCFRRAQIHVQLPQPGTCPCRNFGLPAVWVLLVEPVAAAAAAVAGQPHVCSGH